MAVSVSEVGIGRAVIEAVRLDGTMKVRVARVPSATCNGYILYRAKQRTGWSGLSTDDDGGFEQVATLAQFAATEVFATVSDPSPPANTDVYYRVRAVDNTTTPAEFGAWSNVAAWHYTQSRQAYVPTWPMELRPNFGALKGVVEELQDADSADGPTWYELWLTMAAVVDMIHNEVSQRAGEHALLQVLRDPPYSLQQWFGYQVAADFVPLAELRSEAVAPTAMEARKIAVAAKEEFLQDPILRLPGSSGATATRTGRLVRG